MTLSIEDIAAEPETVTILGLSELAKATKERFDASAAVPITAAGLAAGGAAEGQAGFAVELTAAGDQKVKVIEAIRKTTDLGLKEAKAVIDDAPAPVKETASEEEAEILKAVLEEVSASVVVK